MPGRFLFLAVLACFVLILFVASFGGMRHPAAALRPQPLGQQQDVGAGGLAGAGPALGEGPGRAIAPKLGNETAKAELGRAAWKLMHTTFARFPDHPTAEESEALRQYIHLFQRLYPCGECAEHFAKVLKQYPPQVSSRSSAAAWGCHVHNVVNKRLKKELFDCSKIGDFYDCGCADDINAKDKNG